LFAVAADALDVIFIVQGRVLHHDAPTVTGASRATAQRAGAAT